MSRPLHFIFGLVAMLTIMVFLVSTILVELGGQHAAIAQVKSLIVMPGLWILVPAIALTGMSGFSLSRIRPEDPLVTIKRKRMPFIAANGLLVLIPCALVLNQWAAQGQFGNAFAVVQGLEFTAGAVNLFLMGLNMRDGMRLSGRRPLLNRG